MKKLISIAIFMATIIALSGCSAKTAMAIKITDPISDVNRTEYATVSMSGNISPDTTPLQNTAIRIKEASARLEAKGYKYFSINANIPKIITNMQDLASYCYPKNNGFRKKDLNGKSSSLEEKCQNALYFDIIVGSKEPHQTSFSWSTEQVKNDQNIDNYIKAAIEDAGFSDQKITFVTVDVNNIFKK